MECKSQEFIPYENLFPWCSSDRQLCIHWLTCGMWDMYTARNIKNCVCVVKFTEQPRPPWLLATPPPPLQGADMTMVHCRYIDFGLVLYWWFENPPRKNWALCSACHRICCLSDWAPDAVYLGWPFFCFCCCFVLDLVKRWMFSRSKIVLFRGQVSWAEQGHWQLPAQWRGQLPTQEWAGKGQLKIPTSPLPVMPWLLSIKSKKQRYSQRRSGPLLHEWLSCWLWKQQRHAREGKNELSHSPLSLLA